MTHLDSGGEAGPGWPRLGKMEMGLGVAHHSVRSAREQNKRSTRALFSKPHRVPSPPLPSSPLCQFARRELPAQPSCVVWLEPKDKTCLQPPSLVLSRQVQEEPGGQGPAQQVVGQLVGREPFFGTGGA